MAPPMKSFFPRVRRNRNKPGEAAEDNNSIPAESVSISLPVTENPVPVIPDNEVSSTVNNNENISSSGAGDEPMSPGNSPGEATSTGTFGIRKYLYEYWYQEKGKSHEEKYHALASNSEEDLVTSMDGLDDMAQGNLVAEIQEKHKIKETVLNSKIKCLESALKNCQIENEMLTIMVEDLVKLQETHQEKIDEVKRFYEEKIEGINSNNEIMVNELLLSNQKQVEDFITSHEGLVQDLINSHEQQIREWKVAFEADVDNIPELKDEKQIVGLPATMWKKFLGLSELSQGLVVVGIGILGSVVGLTSWRFLFWAWPKLVSFAATIEAADVVNIIGWLGMFMKSPGYKKFIESWESGKPITKEDIIDFGTDILGFGITHLGPSLLNLSKHKINAAKSLPLAAGTSGNNDMQF